MRVEKLNLQITFNYANPLKWVVDTADIRKNIWWFLYQFLQPMICRNQIEETLYPHLWVCKQFCCKILVQNGGYSLFRARSLTLQSDLPGQHEHWPFLPELHRKMGWKEFLLHIDQALIASSKSGYVGVFVNYVSQHNV